MKSRLPGKKNPDIDAFISGAEDNRTAKNAALEKTAAYPWEESRIREDVNKIYNLRLPEAYLLKLKYISENTPGSMHKFCLTVLLDAIDEKIEELTK
jgi:hypothetical protein